MDFNTRSIAVNSQDEVITAIADFLKDASGPDWTEDASWTFSVDGHGLFIASEGDPAAYLLIQKQGDFIEVCEAGIDPDANDYGDGSGEALRLQIETWLQRAGINLEGGSIRLLTMPRVLGYVFNPISLYYCHKVDGRLGAVVYEVTSTERSHDVEVLSTYAERDILQSGWLLGEPVIAKKAAAVSVKHGDGRVVLCSRRAGRDQRSQRHKSSESHGHITSPLQER